MVRISTDIRTSLLSKMSLSSCATSAIEAVRKYYDSVLLEEDVAIRRAALNEAVAATLRCAPDDQLVVEKQSVEDMDEATRCFKEDFEADEAREQIRLIRKARVWFDVCLCEGRVAVALAKKDTV